MWMNAGDDQYLEVNMECPSDKLRCLYDADYRAMWEYIVIKGGRGGGKTEEVGRWCILTSFEHSDGILCTREIQNSIEDSVYKVLCDWIDELDLSEYFEITKHRITNLVTGAWFIFKGMNHGTKKDLIKSMKGIRYVWYEEAQCATRESLNKLDPTIRMQGRLLIFTLNPEEEDDAINDICAKDNCDTIEINYYDNPWCPEVLWRQAEFCKKHNPGEYNHIWLGQPLMHGERRTVMTLDNLRRCIDAHRILGNCEGHSYGGLDLAPGMEKKNDRNSLVIRKGPVVRYAKNWQSDDLEAIADLVMARGAQFGLARLFFDAVGCGGFATGVLRKRKPKFACVPFMGGNSVLGGDDPYMRSGNVEILNKDYFKNCKSQQWWNLRLRVENTLRLLEGEPVRDPSYYFSIDSETVEDVDGLIRQLAQATWKEDSSGRIIIDKCPGDYEVTIEGKKEKRRSPNDGDSCGYSFVRDFQLRGLKIK